MAGAARSLFELLTHLPAQVVPVVVTTAPGKIAEQCRCHNIECHILAPKPGLMVFGKGALRWSTVRRVQVLVADFVPYTVRLALFLRRQRISLVHANDPRGALLVGAAARAIGVPLVSHLRGRKAYSGLYWRAFEALSNRIVAVCDAIADEVTESYRHKTTTVYNGTRDLQCQEPATLTNFLTGAVGVRGKFSWLDHRRSQGDLVIACFASITPFKGHHHWLEAIATLNARGGRAVIYLAVGGVSEANRAYETWLFRRAHELGINNLTFAGWQQDPFALYRRTDITVLPSVERESFLLDGQVLEVQGNEGFPRTHLEACSFGIPVVGTTIGGVAELVVHESTGLLVAPGDTEALVNAMERLINDDGLRARLGQAGRQRVLEHFSVERCVEGTLGVYRELLWPT